MIIEIFGKKIEVYVTESNCFEVCNYKTDTNGYTRLLFNKKYIFTHRANYMQSIGVTELPDKVFVLHSCDNRKCINLEHLRAGTNADNTQDMILRNRCVYVNKENHGMSKLNYIDVKIIRLKYELGIKNQVELSKEFGIHQSNVSLIINNKHWKP